MNHCVPDWDESGAEIDARPARDSVVSSLKTNRRQATSECAKFLDNEFSELIWTPDGDLVMQVHTNRILKNPQWVSSGFSSGENEDRVAPSKLPDRIKDDTLDAVVISAVRADSLPSNAAALTYAEEDDLISWLQYPDDSLDKNDCSDIFNLPSSQLQIFKDPVIQAGRDQQNLALVTPESPGVMTRSGETSSIVVENNIPLSQGSDAVIRMGTTITPTATPWVTLKNGTLSDSPKKPHNGDTSVSGVTLSASRLPPKPQKVNSAGPLNFSHFSRPAAIAKASLHTLGKCSTSITSHLQVQLKKNDTAGSNAVECSIGSATTARSAMTHNEEFHVQGQSSDVQQSLGSQSSSWPSLKSFASRKELIADCKDNYPNSSAALDTNEQTLTSSSGGSGNSADRVKQSIVKAGKRKSKDVDDSTECQSEDAEGESVPLKKASPARPGSKRSRAAEVHNQSERRRRDRINEKMKALQELIPNSNKTDKASMLDEAIEYLKMLQLQLQMMSMRSGLSLPPMIIPAGMQHLQMPQVATLPHMGMGMGLGMIGMGMGMGVGLMDMNGAATVRPMMPLPLAGPGQTSAATMPLNVDMYHAYILHQQQQIQQQMQLQHQQIQQTQNQQLQPQQQQQQPQQQPQQQHQQQKAVASSGAMQ